MSFFLLESRAQGSINGMYQGRLASGNTPFIPTPGFDAQTTECCAIKHDCWLTARPWSSVAGLIIHSLQTIARPTWALDRLCLLIQQAQCDIPLVHGMRNTKTQKVIKGWKMSSASFPAFLLYHPF